MTMSQCAPEWHQSTGPIKSAVTCDEKSGKADRGLAHSLQDVCKLGHACGRTLTYKKDKDASHSAHKGCDSPSVLLGCCWGQGALVALFN